MLRLENKGAMMDADTDDGLKPVSPGKKPYHQPQLIVYGNIGQITQAVDMVGKADGGGAHNNKT